MYSLFPMESVAMTELRVAYLFQKFGAGYMDNLEHPPDLIERCFR